MKIFQPIMNVIMRSNGTAMIHAVRKIKTQQPFLPHVHLMKASINARWTGARYMSNVHIQIPR